MNPPPRLAYSGPDLFLRTLHLGRCLLALGALAALCAALAEAALAQEVAGDLTEEFRLTADAWTGRLKPVAQRTFALLAAIEFAVSALVWGLRRDSLTEAAGAFFLKCAVLSFLFMLLLFFESWVPAVVDSFAQAGQHAAGSGGLNPTAVAELGLRLNSVMMEKAFGWGLLLSPAQTFSAVWGGFVVMFAFAVIAAQLVILLIESYIAVTAGVFFVGFAAFRGTAGLTDRYLAWAVSVGVRLFLVYLIIGLGMGVAERWATYIESMGAVDFFAAFRVVIGAVIFALVAVIIPNRTARQLTDGLSFGLPEAVRS